MWTQMGQLFWGARFPGHPPGQMQSSGDPKCFSPFAKMDMGDPTASFGHPMVNKPGPSIPGANMMTLKNDPPRSAHSGHHNHHSNHHNGHHGNHHSSHHSIYPLSGHHHGHNINLSSKHKADIGGLLSSNYNSPSIAHQAGSGSLSSMTNPYSHLSNGGPPPSLIPNMQPPPPPPPPPSNTSPTKQQNQERMKKCKAVFGQGQKELWCNKCRWKKKCVRFPEADSEAGKDQQDSPKKAKAKKKISDPPTQVPPQHFKYQNPPHDLPPIPPQQQQAWYNSVVQSITGGTAGLPPDLLQQQQQSQSRYRNAGPSSENSSPSPSLNSQYHRYSSSSQHSGSHLPSPSSVPPQFFGQMPPALDSFDPTKLAKSPVNPSKLAPQLHNKESMQGSHLHNKESMQGQKAPSFNSSPEVQFSGESPVGANTTGLPTPPAPAASSANSTNRKCRALYGFEQKNKWCKPCRNKKRCIQFI